MKKRKPRPRMPTVEGPDETGVSYEIKFLEDKYVGNDLHSMLLILLSLVSQRNKNRLNFTLNKTQDIFTLGKLCFSIIERQYKVDIEQLLLALAEYR